MRTLITFGLGALAMYLLDPHEGRRRRALMREQWTKGKKEIGPPAAGASLEPEKPADTPAGAHHLGR